MKSNAKNLIRRIKKSITARGGAAASRAAVARLVGVSETSVKNWETGKTVTEEMMRKLEDALAGLGNGVTGTLAPPEEVVGKKAAKKQRDKRGSSLKDIVGNLAPPPPADKDTVKRVHGTPIWNGMKIPNQKEEEAKLAKFIATVGIKQLSPASGVLCDNGKVYWQFVAEFPPKAMTYIVKKLNEHNRQVGHDRGVQYGLDMKADNWGWTGVPILFSENGDLLDGQNRMLAGRAYGKPLVFSVGFGLSPTAIKFIDRGRGRDNRQQGQAEGWSYNHTRSLVLGLLHRYDKSQDGVDNLQAPTPGSSRFGGQRNEDLNRHYSAELTPALEFIHGLRWGIGRNALPKHIGTFLFMFMSRVSPEAARYFMLALADGTHTMSGSPIYAVRHRLTKLSGDRNKEPGRHKNLVKEAIGVGDSDVQIARGTDALIMRFVICAWNSFCAGKKNTTGNFRVSQDGVTTAGMLANLGTPCPNALEEAKAFTAEAFEAVLTRARAVRAAEEKKAYDKNRDEGDIKHAAITKTLETA